jgi:hypothetical protein
MKYLSFLAAGLLWSVVFFAGPMASAAPSKKSVKEQPSFDWTLLWIGSWEKNKTLHNRGEVKLNFTPFGLMLRGEAIDRHTMNFELDPPWGDPEKGLTHFLGGLYHKPTGSRLLYGVLDEWGLPARIRNPWIRSAPYAENHKPIMSDIKTTVSSTKEDEAYLYLSSPFINLFSTVKIKGFASAQTKTDSFSPDLCMGLDTAFTKNTGLLLEVFYTGATLPPTKNSTWFSNPPPLPEREFKLYAIGLLFKNPLLSVSSDWAYSETFAWGMDVYANLGIRLTPQLSFGAKSRPLSISLAADGAGERFVYRDGINHGEGFRSAGKIEWKGPKNSLFKADTILRGPCFGEAFNRSSSDLYYRFQAHRDSFPVRLTKISFSTDRNAVNPQKIIDGYRGNLSFSIVLPKVKASSLGVALSGSVKGFSSSETPSPYPISFDSWVFNTAGANCELSWSPLNLQFKSKVGYDWYANKDDNCDISLYAALRFKHGRLSMKAESPDFPEKWNWTVSWRLEKK